MVMSLQSRTRYGRSQKAGPGMGDGGHMTEIRLLRKLSDNGNCAEVVIGVICLRHEKGMLFSQGLPKLDVG